MLWQSKRHDKGTPALLLHFHPSSSAQAYHQQELPESGVFTLMRFCKTSYGAQLEEPGAALKTPCMRTSCACPPRLPLPSAALCRVLTTCF